MLFWGHFLVAKEYHLILQQSSADFGNHVVVKRTPEINAEQLRAKPAGHRSSLKMEVRRVVLMGHRYVFTIGDVHGEVSLLHSKRSVWAD
jgi:hypothetical protein